jgi:hypothetical protein
MAVVTTTLNKVPSIRTQPSVGPSKQAQQQQQQAEKAKSSKLSKTYSDPPLVIKRPRSSGGDIQRGELLGEVS